VQELAVMHLCTPDASAVWQGDFWVGAAYIKANTALRHLEGSNLQLMGSPGGLWPLVAVNAARGPSPDLVLLPLSLHVLPSGISIMDEVMAGLGDQKGITVSKVGMARAGLDTEAGLIVSRLFRS